MASDSARTSSSITAHAPREGSCRKTHPVRRGQEFAVSGQLGRTLVSAKHCQDAPAWTYPVQGRQSPVVSQ
jgi:hypothetical protein